MTKLATNTKYSRIARKIKSVLHFHIYDKFLFKRNRRFLNSNYQGGDILICIMHTGKNKDRVSYLKEYYSGRVDFLFYSDYERLEDSILKVSYADYYESNELKHVNILNLIAKSHINRLYKFVYLNDDDTFVNLDNLYRLVNQLPQDEKVCVGEVITREINSDNQIFLKYPQLKYLSGGAGYIISSKVFQSATFFSFFTGYADVTLGLNLGKQSNIRFINDERFKSQAPEFYNSADIAVENGISFHYIKNKTAFQKCLAASKQLIPKI